MKIKSNVLSNIIKKATSKEIDFIIHIAQFQNKYGQIQGIYYKKVMESLNLSKSSFYNIIESLEAKNILTVDYTHSNTFLWNFSIVGNLFVSSKNYKGGYLNVNHQVLHSYHFMKLSRTAKLICIKALMRNQNDRSEISIMFDDLVEWTGNQKQTVKKAIKELDTVMDYVTFKNRIVIKIDYFFSRRPMTERNIYNRHMLHKFLIEKGFLERGEVLDYETTEGVLKVMTQYQKINEDKMFEIIFDCLKNTGKLIPRYLNAVFSKIYRSYKKNAA